MKLSSLLVCRYYSSLVLFYVVFVRSPPHTCAPYNLSSGEVELRWGAGTFTGKVGEERNDEKKTRKRKEKGWKLDSRGRRS